MSLSWSLLLRQVTRDLLFKKCKECRVYINNANQKITILTYLSKVEFGIVQKFNVLWPELLCTTTTKAGTHKLGNGKNENLK